jgi:hypothetical protein
MRIPQIDIVKAYDFLLRLKARFKVTYGGRGKGASWNYVRSLLVRAIAKKTRIACFREIQKSIDESIKKTIEDQIAKLGLEELFIIQKDKIIGTNGSEFIFEGLLRNVNKIKSLEGVDIADVEEAESVSENSWKLLIPTIRREWSTCCNSDIDLTDRDKPVCIKCGKVLTKDQIEYSEIWIRFNTKYTDDATYQRFVAKPPQDSIVKFINWDQNPQFPEVLRREKDQDYAIRPLEAKNIWGGEPIGHGRKVWQSFEEKVHVRSMPMEKVKEAGNCFMAMDPAQHYYPACLWGALIPKDGNKKEFWKYIYAEWPTRDELGADFHEVRKKLVYTGSLEDMARQIYMKDGTSEYGIKILKRGIDTRFAKGSGSANYFSNSSLGIVQEFAKKENGGLVFDMPSEKTIDVQKMIITKDMQYNTLIPLSPFNDVNLIISPNLTNLIISMNNHRLKEDAEQEDDKYKDFSDTLKILYATMADWIYKDPNETVITYSQQSFMSQGDVMAGGWMA